jgi:hypothetical protein
MLRSAYPPGDPLDFLIPPKALVVVDVAELSAQASPPGSLGGTLSPTWSAHETG